MIKCPHCNGLLEIKVVGQAPLDDSQNAALARLTAWVNEPVRLYSWLMTLDSPGNLLRFGDDRWVIRTAFRTRDFLRDTGIVTAPEAFRSVAARLPLWGDQTELRSVLGVQGRFWLRRGYESYPGVVEQGEFEEIEELV